MSAADQRSRSTWCFSVFAAPEPGVMPRVLELFAKRGLVPRRVHGNMVGSGPGGLEIDVHVDGLPEETAAHVANCLRGLVEVERVLTATRHSAGVAGAAL